MWRKHLNYFILFLFTSDCTQAHYSLNAQVFFQGARAKTGAPTSWYAFYPYEPSFLPGKSAFFG